MLGAVVFKGHQANGAPVVPVVEAAAGNDILKPVPICFSKISGISLKAR